MWDEKLFKLIGASFGVFLNFDKDTIVRKRLDMARILVRTSRRGFIDEEFRIKVMGQCLSYGWWRRKVEVEEEAFSVGSREGEWVGSGEKSFSEEGGGSPRSYNSVHLGVGPFTDKEGPTTGSLERQKEKLGDTFLPCKKSRERLEDKFSKNPVGIGQVSAQTACVGECSGEVMAREGDFLADQHLVGQEVTSSGPPLPSMVEFPPLRKCPAHGPGPVLLLRGAKSLEGDKMVDGPKASVFSDSVLITNKQNSAFKGVQLANKHIRFNDESDCSDLSDSIEDYAHEDERLLNLKKKL